ncbi:MAG TPA: hypothetical protein VM791_20420 [Vicinamibacterales bacterium]|jgi:hypothetical protein|nr:hypothetical protein [Vicinamibacterales bacterium]
MHDPFVGTWKLNASRSEFDPNHRPAEATMRWQLQEDNSYLMLAEGGNQKGERVAEKPQLLRPDGLRYPVDGFPGLTTVTTRVNEHTLRAEARRQDGSLAGEGTYVVGDDGRYMNAVTAGFDSQLRRFEMRTSWDRV